MVLAAKPDHVERPVIVIMMRIGLGAAFLARLAN
jgi:hypothetical protein